MNGRLILAAIGLGASLLLGGCNSTKKADYSTAVEENSELRSRLDEAQASLTDVNERNRALTAANEQLSDENQRLANSIATGRSGAGATGELATGEGYDTRFTGAGREIVMEVAGDVLFKSGQIAITADGKRVLDRVAARINSEFSGRTVRVEGYTDSDPIRKSGWKTNERLSAERALAVEEYMVSKGVNKDRIYSAAYGSSNPRSSKPASRRVEIVILAD